MSIEHLCRSRSKMIHRCYRISAVYTRLTTVSDNVTLHYALRTSTPIDQFTRLFSSARGNSACGASVAHEPSSLHARSCRSAHTLQKLTRKSVGEGPGKRHFSKQPYNMVADRIDGTAIAKNIREKINADIKKIQETNPRYKPSLTIIQVGDRSDSSTYVKMKLKAAEEANIICDLVNYPEDISEAELLQNIYKFNNDFSTHGILVQLPVPKHLSEHHNYICCGRGEGRRWLRSEQHWRTFQTRRPPTFHAMHTKRSNGAAGREWRRAQRQKTLSY